jgi:stage II sporulation protein E
MLKEMVMEKNKHISSAVLTAAAFIGAALLSYSTMSSVTSPVCCGLAGALSPGYAAAVFAGSALTYLISGTAVKNGFIICSLLLILVGKWLMKDENVPKFCAIVTFVSMAFSGIVFGALVDRNMMNVLLNIFISALTGTAAYFIKRAVDIVIFSDVFRLEKKNLTVFAVVYTIAVSALCGISVSVINLGRIAGIVLVLLAAKRFRYSGGVISGVLTTAGIFISSPELGLPAAFLGIAGLAAGYAADYSRITIAAAFLAVDFCGQLLTGMNDASFCMQADAVVGAIIFMLLPAKIVMSGGIVLDGDSDGSGSEVIRAEMDFAALSLLDVRKNVEEIIEALERKSAPYSAINEVSSRVCGKCRNKLNCWEKNYEKTNSYFIKIEKQKDMDIEFFPSGLECCRKREIIDNFARCRKEEAVNKMMSARLNENRSFLFSQMETTEDIISSISENLKFSYSKTMTRELCAALDKYDVNYSTAIAYYNQNERLIIEIYTKNAEQEDAEAISDILSCELRVPMEFSEPVSCSGETRLRFNQQTKYKIQYASAQSSAEENQPSGDSCGFFCDGLGNAYVFISDGMGSGSQAAVDSRIVSNLFKRLVRSGIECSAAVKMINSIMLAKSNEESFATLDIGKINLETCELTLYKSGAASTLIKYSDSVMMFNSPSNPIGIIPDSKISQRECNFNEDDVLVMLSDGVDESMYVYIKEQLQTVYDLKTMTENVCAGAKKKFSEIPKDDITVAAARVVLRSGN